MRAVQFHPFYCEEAVGSKCTEWDTSHDLSVITADGQRVRIGSFKHAEWASEVGRMIEANGLSGITP